MAAWMIRFKDLEIGRAAHGDASPDRRLDIHQFDA
jgi:hypothetical protein